MGDWMSSAAIYVRDRRRSAKWYCDNFGWKVFHDDPEHWTTVGAPRRGGHIHLCELGRKPRASEVGESGLLIVCSDFAATTRRLRRNGARWATHPTRRPWGWNARVKDPDGNILWLSNAT